MQNIVKLWPESDSRKKGINIKVHPLDTMNIHDHFNGTLEQSVGQTEKKKSSAQDKQKNNLNLDQSPE